MRKRKRAEMPDFEQMTTQQKMQYLHDNVDIAKAPKEEKDPKKKRKMIACVSLYVLCYVILLGVIFGMIVLNGVFKLNDALIWLHGITSDYSQILLLLLSVFFLVVIIFFYFFFEDRDSLVSTANTLLIFSTVIVCAVICFLFEVFISTYARPFALFALLVLFLLNRRHAIFLNFIFTILIFVIDMYTHAYEGMELAEVEVYSTLMVGFVSGTLAKPTMSVE